jgi:hypothetical protein
MQTTIGVAPQIGNHYSRKPPNFTQYGVAPQLRDPESIYETPQIRSEPIGVAPQIGTLKL